ncbi:sulfite exporter TauE/SafE family protein [Candidatus Uhrbacteria bacterium]|nr:sulfite exporter TauE/SafE family protein [Candidatus Uhrbacteria bacterium]
MTTLRLHVPGLHKANADLFEEAALAVPGVRGVDSWTDRAEILIEDGVGDSALLSALAEAGFRATAIGMRQTTEPPIDMSCSSCEVAKERPSALRLLGLFGAVWLLGTLGKRIGLFDSGYQIGGSSHFFSALAVGVVAGSSSCMAVSGGLMLSTLPKLRSSAAATSGWLARLQPSLLFVGGRISAYAILGGVIGVLGTALTLSPAATAAVTVFAALVMLVMGLDMLGLAPRRLLSLLPRMPKRLAHRIMDADGRAHRAMPAILGAATFFIPCGFTQAFQIYALTTGDFLAGASVLGGFALGTAPALLAVGWASSSLTGRVGKLFMQFSGALVIVLGLANVQNGMTIAGYPLALPDWPLKAQASVAAVDPNVRLVGSTQVIKMKISGQEPFYSPSDRFTVKAGQPVRMEIEGIGAGCRTVFQIPKFGVKVALVNPVNVVEFTPDKPGDAVFSCSMGMFRGSLNVVRS